MLKSNANTRVCSGPYISKIVENFVIVALNFFVEEDISYNAVESEAYWTQFEQIFVASSTISVVTVGTATLNVLLFSLIFGLDCVCLSIG